MFYASTNLCREVETQTIGCHQTAFLVGLTEDTSEGEIEDVGTRVVTHEAHTPRGVERDTHLVTHGETSLKATQVEDVATTAANAED